MKQRKFHLVLRLFAFFFIAVILVPSFSVFGLVSAQSVELDEKSEITTIQPLSFDNNISHIDWPFPSSDSNNRGLWDIRGFNHGDIPHDPDPLFDHWESDMYAEDWGLPGDDDCNKDFYAPFDGKVLYAGWVDNSRPTFSYGLNVVIQSSSNPDFAFRVGHLNSISIISSIPIKAGQKIGTIGTTGNSTKCHAHLVLYKNLSAPYGGYSSAIEALSNNINLGVSEGGPTTFAAKFLPDLNSRGSLSGYVKDKDGNNVHYPTVLFLSRGNEPIYATSFDNGQYYFSNLMPGDATVIAYNNNKTQSESKNLYLVPLRSSNLNFNLTTNSCVPTSPNSDFETQSTINSNCLPIGNGVDNSQFINDITVPDGTVFPRGQTFTKTWQVKNIGTSTWDSSYKLVLQSGYQMVGQSSVNLTQAVAPNGTINISATLTSPTVDGNYRANWMLMNNNGKVFGDLMWVSIKVLNGTPPPSTQGTVKLFNQINYAGTVTYSSGIAQSNSPNADSFSLQIPTGWSVRTYKSDGFSGEERCWTQSVPNLQDHNWQNAIQSIKIFNYDDCSGGQSVKLYSGINFNNLVGSYGQGITNDPSRNAYSMSIPAGWSVRTYRQDNRAGGDKCWSTSQANLQDTDNWQLAIDSMEVFTADVCPAQNNDSWVKICRTTGSPDGNCPIVNEDVESLDNFGFGDNTLKSIEIRGDWEVVLYEHGNFGGRFYHTDASHTDLSTIPFGYGTSSMQVRRRGPALFTLYNSRFFNDGGPFTSDRTITNLEGWERNDQTQAVKVAAGYEAIFCTDANFRGKCGRTNVDQPDINAIGDGLSNQISSVQVCQGSCPPTSMIPVVDNPLDGTNFLPGSDITFDWIGNGDEYSIEYWGGNLGSTQNSGGINNATSWTKSGLPGSANPYYWHIRSWTPYGQTDWSQTYSFKVQDIAPLVVNISGESNPELNTDYTYYSIVNPDDSANLAYNWTPEPKSGQGTSAATYNFNEPGALTISLAVQNTGGSASGSFNINAICASGTYLSEYYDNKDLSGSAVAKKCENQINYDWGTSGPLETTSTSVDTGTGADGDLTVAAGQTIYTDDVRTKLNNSVSAGSNTINVKSNSGFAVGQEIMIIQSRGGDAGIYELKKISAINGNTFTLTSNLTNAYTSDGAASLTDAQVQKVQQYNNVTVSGILTSHIWNGETGGIIVFKARKVNLLNSGLIDVSALGYTGGDRTYGAAKQGLQGESYNGVGGYNRSPNLNGGGGGGGSNDGGAAAGGGSYASLGGNGYDPSYGDPGLGATTLYGTPDLSKLYFGGGGGAGGTDDSGWDNATFGGSGGKGGGIIYIQAGTIIGNGTLNAKGGGGENHNGVDSSEHGGGGGGAGGSIKLVADKINTDNLNPTVAGSGGGKAKEGLGGAGGNGILAVKYCNSIGANTVPGNVEIIPNCTKDNFSIRWTTSKQFPTANDYTFKTFSDDGIRVWIDNNQIINNWTDGSHVEQSTQSVTAGNHEIKVEYYENAGNANANFLIFPANNHEPVISQIPNQLIGNGESFTQINLNNYVTDADNDPITWSYRGNSILGVTIDASNIATVTYPQGWSSNENVIFKAKDQYDAFSESTVNFKLIPCTNGEFYGEYYSNKTLSGDIAFTKCSAQVNFDWTNGGPSAEPSIDLGDGRDGDLNVAASTTKYADDVRSSVTTTATLGGSILTVQSSTGFTQGDKVLVIQMQGINAGVNETSTIQNIAGSNLTMLTALKNTYTVGGGGVVQIIKILQYRNVTIDGTLTAHAWDGSTGGIVIFKASGTLVVNGTINLTGLGFRKGTSDCCSQDSFGGEGIYGQLRQNAANGNGAGAGHQAAEGGPGGGGGGNVLTPGESGFPGGHPNAPAGQGGLAIDNSNFTKLVLGGGGGAGGRAYSNPGGAGGNGGGILQISARTFTVNGTIQNNGTNGTSGTTAAPGPENQTGRSGGGGGGAGGTVLLQGANININTNKVTAMGGPRGGGPAGSGGNGVYGGVKIEYCNTVLGNSSPGANIGFKECGVGVDNFSVRWTGIATTEAAKYTLKTNADDGLKVFIDNNLQIDKWVDGNNTDLKSIDMTAGSHEVKAEYYENTGNAHVSLSFAKNAAPTISSTPVNTIAVYTGPGQTGTATFPAQWDPKLGIHVT